MNRREMIIGGASLLALGGAAAYTRAIRSADTVRVTGPAVPAFDPKRDLKGLGHPLSERARIGGVEISRLILGGNMIGGWAHTRDLRFYDRLVKAYFTDERVFRTFQIAEACGVNTISTNPELMRVINRYWREAGGRIKFISDSGYGSDLVRGAEISVENGASMVYAIGSDTDRWAIAGDWRKFRQYLDEVRKLGRPTGIGCHRLATVKFCVEHDCIPDFWMKTVHRVDYPTAHLGEDRGMKSSIELGACDNRFVDTGPQAVYDYMATRPEPWIAFKILGAGIEHPRTAFRAAYAGGADVACVGMYDYQLVEDVNIANEVFSDGLPARKRPWHG